MNTDWYTLPMEGGVPSRVTHHPASETLCDWTPREELLFYTNAFTGLRRQTRLMTVPPKGGLPTQLPPLRRQRRDKSGRSLDRLLLF